MTLVPSVSVVEVGTCMVSWVTEQPGAENPRLEPELADAFGIPNMSDTAWSLGVHTNHTALEWFPAAVASSIVDQVWTEPLGDLANHVMQELAHLFRRFEQYPGRCRLFELPKTSTDLLKDLSSSLLVIHSVDECFFDPAQDGPTLIDTLECLSAPSDGELIVFCPPSYPWDTRTSFPCRSTAIKITPLKTKVNLHQLFMVASQQLERDINILIQALGKVKAEGKGSLLSKPRSKDVHLHTTVEDLSRKVCCGDSCRATVSTEGNSSQACRRVLLVLLGWRHVVLFEQLSDTSGLISTRTEPTVLRWLLPLDFVGEGLHDSTHAAVRDFMQGQDPILKADKSSRLVVEDRNSTMAKRCLECLFEETYGDSKRIARCLTSSFYYETLTGDSTGDFYDYAARNWDTHLVKLVRPADELLELVSNFLRSLQFAHWAEYVLDGGGDFQAIRATQTRLTEWSRLLEDDDRDLLILEVYFEIPYMELNKVYAGKKEDDTILPWLPLMRLGSYYFDSGRIKDMKNIRNSVAKELCNLLGKKNPLALRAQSEATFALLSEGHLSKAHEIWGAVAADQEDVLSKSQIGELYRTLFYKGMAEYYMNDYSAAVHTLACVSAKLHGSEGPRSNLFLVAKLWYSQVKAAKGELEIAAESMEDIRKIREELYGRSDGFATLTRIFLGDVYRQCGEKETSIAYLEEALEQRKRLWSITHPLVIDASIRLAISYRDFNLDRKAREILDVLEERAQLEEKDKFYEYCQTRHLKALLLLGDGNTDEAISILQELLINAEPCQVIRPLQWVRTDLADMLRFRSRESDKHLASVIFDGVVVAKRSTKGNDGEDDEPNPARQLHIAEKALRLYRTNGPKKAQAFLDREEFEWTCEASMWLFPGMPAGDTTVIKPPLGWPYHYP